MYKSRPYRSDGNQRIAKNDYDNAMPASPGADHNSSSFVKITVESIPQLNNVLKALMQILMHTEKVYVWKTIIIWCGPHGCVQKT